MSLLAPSLPAFFTDRLITQRRAPNTIAATATPSSCCCGSPQTDHADPPSKLDIAQLDAPLITAFLDHLENHRGNTIRTRNHRLAAIHSLFAYPALHHPEHAAPSNACSRSRTNGTTQEPADLPHRARSQRAARRLRPKHLDRPPRPRNARAHDPNRPADLRARHAHPPGHHARHRRQRPHLGRMPNSAFSQLCRSVRNAESPLLLIAFLLLCGI